MKIDLPQGNCTQGLRGIYMNTLTHNSGESVWRNKQRLVGAHALMTSSRRKNEYVYDISRFDC
jgi:hypothetical protein